MATVLVLAFSTLLVLGAAGAAALLHRAMTPPPDESRSATALRELQPTGGRHRFHVRLFEVALLCALLVAATGLCWLALLAGAPFGTLGNPVVLLVASSLLVSLWWAWRRGTLRVPPAAESPVSAGPRSREGSAGG